MQHLPNLITDLALILGAAAVISLLFRILKQPIVLGYIIAGLLVGPHVKLLPTVIETEGITIWAEIGVLFLLFGLGLEFSFKKLVRVGGVAVITALLEIIMTITFGFLLAKMMGWKFIDCLFMGGILAIASTTIIIKTFDELGVKSQKFAGIVMGVLIVEDLVAVVLMVILSTVSISQSFEGTEMIYSILKLVFFLVLWFVGGIFFVPSLLKLIKKYLSEEILLILSLALCFMMVVLASKAGFSPALGAFIMGSILAETTKAEKIEHLILSIKNLFGAIFFVSVGMLINPAMIVEYAWPIAGASLVLLFIKPFFVTLGALISGETLKTSVQSGMSLSQIGEFSFIIATLGLSLNVISEFLYPIAVAVSVITTFTTPYMIRFSEPFYRVINRALPLKWKNSLDRYSLGTQKITEASDWKKMIRFYLSNILIFSVVIITIILISTHYFSFKRSDDELTYRFITSIFSFVILSPFLWALAFRRPDQQVFNAIWSKPTQRGPLLMLLFSRVILSLFFLGFFFYRMFSPFIAFSGVIIAIVLLYLLRKKIRQLYSRIESRFLSNLHEREIQAQENTIQTPWDSHIATFEMNPVLPFIGQTLFESQLREKFGINIAVIKRGELIMNVPKRTDRIYPNDIVSVIGTDEQLTRFKEFIESFIQKHPLPNEIHEVSLNHFTLSENCALVGQTIRSSEIRERTKGLVVGVERGGGRILNPESDLVFEAHDTVWMVGDEKRIQIFIKQQILD